jgi:hypothetical protein
MRGEKRFFRRFFAGVAAYATAAEIFETESIKHVYFFSFLLYYVNTSAIAEYEFTWKL